MTKKLLVTVIALLVSGAIAISYAQCTPEGEETCPDPQNNGQVCPDSLVGGIAGQLYSQVATILPPPYYVIPESRDTIQLHHVQLMAVDSLPPGITWVSNAANNEFMVGVYYCILLEGTPTMAGDYILRIVVDIYAEAVPGVVIKIGSETDSTSLSINVIWDPNSIPETEKGSFYVLEGQPNPFYGETRIGIFTAENEKVSLLVLDYLGKVVWSEGIHARAGENYFNFNGRKLSPGLYHYVVADSRHRLSDSFIKIE